MKSRPKACGRVVYCVENLAGIKIGGLAPAVCFRNHQIKIHQNFLFAYVSGSSKIQTLLPFNVIEISPHGFKFCNSVEKYVILLDGNNVWILLEPLTYIHTAIPYRTTRLKSANINCQI